MSERDKILDRLPARVHACPELEVADLVVIADAVPVMNGFSVEERAAEMIRHGEHMGIDLACAIRVRMTRSVETAIALLGQRPSRIANVRTDRARGLNIAIAPAGVMSLAHPACLSPTPATTNQTRTLSGGTHGN